ncbi:MAG TPA: hypothetical protein VFJ07_13595 [Streptosporangiaceae bacterium]|nr:hypothetical protein [Streptosporangiaceae bacterium]
MARMQVSAERTVDAAADTVYRYIADMREHHPRFLPPAFSDFQVEAGGAGTFAPRMVRAILTDELGRLDAYAREHRPA